MPATGANVSKTEAYSVTAPPAGGSVSKTNAYSVTGPPAGGSVSKVLAYAVISTAPPAVDGQLMTGTMVGCWAGPNNTGGGST
jgi:hypothetical protein